MTTEERIAQIAQGFGQGIQNFQSAQARQEAQALQEEARRRQQALQEVELAQSLGNQYGRDIMPEQVRPILAGGQINLAELLASTPQSQKAMAAQNEAQRLAQKQELEQQKLMAQIANLRGGKGEKPQSYREQLQVQKLERELAQPKISPSQSMVATYAERLNQAENVFNDLAKEGYNRSDFLNAIGSALPSSIQSKQSQMQEQAERNFVNAVLRRESGAAISPTEFESAEKQYFPRAGDAPEVIAQKKRNREIALSGFQAEAGPQALAQIRGVMGTQPQQAPAVQPQAKPRITANIPQAPAILGVPADQVATMSAQDRQALRQQLLQQREQALRQTQMGMK